MELHQVRYFLTVANTLNFTRAAEQCNVTQPALTKGLQKLEHELGGLLIHRERQLTQLTDLGKAVLPVLEATLSSADAARHRAREFHKREIAPLTIGLAPSVTATLALGPIAEVSKSVPGLSVQLTEDGAGKLVDLLLRGQINAAFVGDLHDLPARIDEWVLFEERYVVMLARNHQLANRHVISLAELRQAMILRRVGCDAAHKLQKLPTFAGGLKWGHGSERELHLQHMAAAGLGVVLAPEHMPHIPALKTIRIEEDPLKREVRLLVAQGRRYSPALDAYVKGARLRDWSSDMPAAQQWRSVS
jgi:DNA-binding transcriptional LysR family regulator